jgi:hypothetical protein
MALLSDEVVRAYLSAPGEMPAAIAYARSCGLEPEWDEHALVLRLPLLGVPAPSGEERPIAVSDIKAEHLTEPFLLEGVFDDYRVLPPIWRFLDHRNGNNIGTAAYPQPRGASVLHGQGLICAHFSRMAYKEYDGPHENWNGVQAWENRVEGTEALTVSDMVARLIWETRYNSQGRMSPLQPCAIAA